MTYVIRFALALTLTALFACSTKTDQPIIGKWRESGKTEVIQFMRDNTVTIADQGTTVPGTYTIDKGQLRMKLEGPLAAAGTIAYTVTLNGDNLSLKDQRGNILNYKKTP